MSKSVLAVDPGGTTGIAVMLPDGSYHTMIALEPEQLYEFIDPAKVELVIYENFAAQIISKYGIHTIRIVGGIPALCWKFRIPVIQHQPSYRKPMLLQAKEYLNKNKGTTWVVHEQDALSHLMMWARRKPEGYLVGTEKDKQLGLPIGNLSISNRPKSKRFNVKDLGRLAK